MVLIHQVLFLYVVVIQLSDNYM